MRQLKNLLILSVIALNISGCDHGPIRPVIRICIIDYIANEAICGDTKKTNALTMEDITDNDIRELLERMGPVKRVPLSTLDRATAFAPREWEKLINYVGDLERYAKKHCKGMK